MDSKAFNQIIMDAAKSLYGISTWILRIAVLVILYMIFFVELRNPDFNNKNFWISSAYVFSGILLFIGGFLKKSTVTIISSVLLIAGCIYKVVLYYFFSTGHFIAIYFVLFSLALFFLSNGNRKK